MTYNEFITITGWSEEYIPYELYTDMIEPIYNNSDKDKHQWCKAVYKAYSKTVYPVIEMAISALGTSTLEAIVFDGDHTPFGSIKALDDQLKDTFFKALQSSAFRARMKI